MINITNKSECCGCNACVQRCPKQCIKMIEDTDGFLYPYVDQSICIECGLCEKVCPVINRNESKHPLHVYAAKNKKEDQRLLSSSGGVFILLAERIIKSGGVVFGARFDKNWEVEHCYAETIEDLEPLMRSKYVQSRIGNTYSEAEQFLKQGRKVLFVGTSCQISGLKKFLRKEYDNLLAVDFICHGVPSPGIWRKYLDEIKSSRREAAVGNTVLSVSLKSVPVITGINFREKQHGGYGWKKYGFVVYKKSHDEGDKNTVLLSSVFSENPFMKGFLSNFYLRPSCYQCPSKGGSSGSDMTIADFWGIQNMHPDFDDDKGVGVVFIHTNQGKIMFDLVSEDMEIIESSELEVTAYNKSYYKSVGIPKKYKLFWKTFNRTGSVLLSVEKVKRRNFLKRLSKRIKSIMNKMFSTKR